MRLIHYIFLILLCMFSCTNKKDANIILYQDFNEKQLDTSIWNFDQGNGCPDLCGWGNNELQLYSKENINLKDGKLIIKASKNDSVYFSGKIHTKNKFEFKYGTVEVKAKLPKGYGLWPAIWLLGNDIDTNTWPGCGEIDMMEHVGKEPNQVFFSLHNPSSFGNTIHSKKITIQNIQDDYHIYKMKWTKSAIEFFVDDQSVYTYRPKVKNDQTWPYDKPFYLILNLAIGGNFGGPEVDDTIFPQEFMIDYIKVSLNK